MSTATLPAGSTRPFEPIPALDLRGGRVVRLEQGDYGRETVYGDDPVAIARRYADAGARWLHLVDLEAARDGGYSLHALVRELRAAGLRLQTGGGVRSRSDVERLLEAGAARVVVGSMAVREPETVAGWLRDFEPGAVTVALDARQGPDGEWRLPVAGWTRDGGATLDALLQHYVRAGLVHLLCTDIERDGLLAGPNLGLYQWIVRRAPGLQVQASGGIRDIADIVAAREAGCAAAILGRALLEGRFGPADAAAERRPC